MLDGCKSTRSLAAALTRAGHPVSDFVVRRLLHQLGYSSQANAKITESTQHPDRDARFIHFPIHRPTSDYAMMWWICSFSRLTKKDSASALSQR